MATEKRLIEAFKHEIMNEFIKQCRGNDFNKLTLLRIGETLDRIYEKYSTIPAVDAVEVVRCKDCFANGCCSVQIDLDMGDEGYCPKGRKEN